MILYGLFLYLAEASRSLGSLACKHYLDVNNYQPGLLGAKFGALAISFKGIEIK